jgi:hypothetical protein
MTAARAPVPDLFQVAWEAIVEGDVLAGALALEGWRRSFPESVRRRVPSPPFVRRLLKMLRAEQGPQAVEDFTRAADELASPLPR